MDVFCQTVIALSISNVATVPEKLHVNCPFNKE